jgi:hypothetical protein
MLRRTDTSFAGARNCIKFVVSRTCRSRSPIIAIQEIVVMGEQFLHFGEFCFQIDTLIFDSCSYC